MCTILPVLVVLRSRSDRMEDPWQKSQIDPETYFTALSDSMNGAPRAGKSGRRSLGLAFDDGRFSVVLETLAGGELLCACVLQVSVCRVNTTHENINVG